MHLCTVRAAGIKRTPTLGAAEELKRRFREEGIRGTGSEFVVRLPARASGSATPNNVRA